ncbi:class I SAM-dependent methyltransferase [Azospirillum halopraeferens]|uniref:class I SAM-dependent methyltransferase n=1 Tax=Azospirillum halopraeferens TaxID=34010 RepID=UPI000404ACE9|nr:class I SAM-dependent methyltransferase [Azospirillum halopraeferens]
MRSLTRWIRRRDEEAPLSAGAAAASDAAAEPAAQSKGEGEGEDARTATRATLTDEWKQRQAKVDWMHAPQMAPYVNGLVSGRAMEDGGHWSAYACNLHVRPLYERRRASGADGGTGLSMLAVGCGTAHIERSLVEAFRWPVSRLVGLEYDDALRAAAAASFAELPEVDATFRHFDFNGDNSAGERFDIVFCCHAIHHATEVEGLLRFINASLKDDGLFIGIEYFGPTRFQIEHDVLPIIEELFAMLPPDLRRDLGDPDGAVAERFRPATIAEVAGFDPSESVRSSDLRTLLFATFPVLDLKPMGGTILRWLLQNRAGNFRDDDPNHVAIIRLLQFIEREFIALRRIRSDDLFFVVGKSDRI